MGERGTYGRTRVGAEPYGHRGLSFGTMLLGGFAVGVAVLWAKHQSDQLKKLYATSGLPYDGFARSLGARTRELSGAAREKFQGLAQRFGTRKELEDGT
jgi:hypothetical protein